MTVEWSSATLIEMPSPKEVARVMLGGSHVVFTDNVKTLTLDEALFSAGGYRSILGVMKHLGGWLHVYRSYALDPEPRHWAQTSWPRGLRDEIEPTADYLPEVSAWIDRGFREWDDGIAALEDEELSSDRPLHWGPKLPLLTIVGIVAQHSAYHTGELNMLLAIKREEAWEYTEEVEENHISTFGHGVRAAWMSEEHARAHEEALRAAHEARLSG